MVQGFWKPARRVLIVGKTQSGKTYLARQLLRPSTRLIALDLAPDPDNSWSSDCVSVDSWDEAVDQVTRERFRIAYQGIDDPIDSLTVACQLAMAEDVGRCVLVVDELRLFFRRRGVPPPEIVEDIFRLARVDRPDYGIAGFVSPVLITQRPIDCPIDLRSQLTDIYAFQTTEPADVAWLSDVVGGRQEAQKVLALARRQYIHWDLTLGESRLCGEDSEGSDGTEDGGEGRPDHAGRDVRRDPHRVGSDEPADAADGVTEDEDE